MSLLKKIKSNSGLASTIISPVSIILGTMFFLIFLEVFKWYLLINRISDTMRQQSIYIMTENYNETYNSLRQGYSGAYTNDKFFKNIVDYGDIYKRTAFELELVQNGSNYEKLDKSGLVVWYLSNFSGGIDNPEMLDRNDNLIVVLTVNLEIPVRVAGFSLPNNLIIPIKTKSKWLNKF